MKTPTIFFGASSYVVPVIEYLYNNFDLQLVVTTEQKPTDAVPKFCREHSIPYLALSSLKDEEFNRQSSIINSQFAILADFSLLVPQSIIDMFPKGIINIHPSLLPAYRGPTPGMSAILHGDSTTGISIMLLDKELDHGPLIGQVTSPIYPNDTSGSLYPRLFQEGTELLKKVLPDYLEGKMQPQEQDHSKATYSEPHLTRATGFIDVKEIEHLSPLEIARKIRAYYPWPSVWTRLRLGFGGQAKEKIVKLLPEDKIQIEGKKPVSYKDFMNGYPEGKEILEKLGLLP